MDTETVAYYSEMDKSDTQAFCYSKTHDSTHRYLAYRDIPSFLQKYSTGKKALDYGTGTGYSAYFLKELGFDVTGVDISKKMIEQAQVSYPHISFYPIEDENIPLEPFSFDLIFSSFVLFEMNTQEGIRSYLSKAKNLMNNGSVFVAVTGSQEMHSPARDWLNFNTNFPENENPKSGSVVKVHLNDFGMEFTDYYWTEEDYRRLFLEAGFDLLEAYYPLGEKNEPYPWKDETTSSPFLVLVAKLKN
jgi:SAM-dependent methyltransferase